MVLPPSAVLKACASCGVRRDAAGGRAAYHRTRLAVTLPGDLPGEAPATAAFMSIAGYAAKRGQSTVQLQAAAAAGPFLPW